MKKFLGSDGILAVLKFGCFKEDGTFSENLFQKIERLVLPKHSVRLILA